MPLFDPFARNDRSVRRTPRAGGAMLGPDAYWSIPADRLMGAVRSGPDGLASPVALRRLRRYGRNALRAKPRATGLLLFLRQFESPLILILMFAAATAAVMKDWTDAAIVLAIVFGSGVVSFFQERRASVALEQLRARVRSETTALRDGKPVTVASDNIVPGDVVLLSAGSLVPADGVVLEAKNFFVTQAVLTGESLPVEKQPGVRPARSSLAERQNCVFMGTSVRSGTARVLILRTGIATLYGGIADKLRLRPPETEFERGIRRYGYLLTRIMLVLVLVVLAANVFLDRPPVDSLLFAIALAVGMSPELLPAIISLTLSRGARELALRGVIVRRLNAIENFGSMDILCSDKTGTLTRGTMALDRAVDAEGASSEALLRDAYLNARHQTGLANPLDDAIVAAGEAAAVDVARCRKIDEVPYDFVRKRLSVAFETPEHGEDALLITKGGFAKVLEVCDRVRHGAAAVPLDDARRDAIGKLFAEWSGEGFRVLGVAVKTLPRRPVYARDDEAAMVFTGFLLFLDPPKEGVRETLAALSRLGVRLKIITGDNGLVAAYLARSVGIEAPRILTGDSLDGLRDEALWRLAESTDLFVEVDPSQKERIILALKKSGHVVGYLGDGINDASALHAADVGISVDEAVDVAKEAADFVLLERDLDVLRRGIEEGRTTFANTLKYIAIITSANFGNMISMAAASMFLPFLPLLAKQILLNNFLSSFPSMAIASDNADPEMVARPRRWDIRSIRNFMLIFGLISSAFDFLTFGVLLSLFGNAPELFRTGWFVESLLTQLAVVLVVRTYRPFYRSPPGLLLGLSTAAVIALTLALPFLPAARFFELVPLPLWLLGLLLVITALYVATTEAVKRKVYGRS